MKNKFAALLVVALWVTTAAYGSVVGKTTEDPNAAPKVEAAAQVPAGTGDKRLDQKISFDAPDARLHDVIATICEKTGIAIYCGSSSDDWHVRDIPVTVAAQEITVRKLLEYLVYSTHTVLTESKTEDSRVYRIRRDPELQEAINNYQKAREKFDDELRRWSFDKACTLKDLPASAIKQPDGSGPGWWDSFAASKEASKILAALDEQTKARIFAGEPIWLSPKTAPAGMRDLLLGYLKAVDTKSVNSALTRSAQENAAAMPDIKNALPGELESARVRIALSNGDVSVTGNVRVQEAEYGTGNNRSSYDSISSMAHLTSKGTLKLPQNMHFPVNPTAAGPGPDLKSINDTQDLMQKKITLKFDKEKVSPAEALIALAKESGMSVVCEDFRSHTRETNLKTVFGAEKSVADSVKQALYLNWLIDNGEKVLVGSDYNWAENHRNMIPAQVLENIMAKANGDGVDFDDLAALSAYNSTAVSNWLGYFILPNLPSWSFTMPDNKPIFMLYSSLSAKDKAITKTESGIGLGERDRKEILPWIKQMINNDSSGLYNDEMQESPWVKLTDPNICPTLYLRLQINRINSNVPDEQLNQEIDGIKIPAGFFKKHNCFLNLEGYAGKEKVSIGADGGYQLPYFAPEREKQLSEAVKKAEKQRMENSR